MVSSHSMSLSLYSNCQKSAKDAGTSCLELGANLNCSFFCISDSFELEIPDDYGIPDGPITGVEVRPASYTTGSHVAADDFTAVLDAGAGKLYIRVANLVNSESTSQQMYMEAEM